MNCSYFNIIIVILQILSLGGLGAGLLGAGAGAAMAFAPKTEWLVELHNKDMDFLDSDNRFKDRCYARALAMTAMEHSVNITI